MQPRLSPLRTREAGETRAGRTKNQAALCLQDFSRHWAWSREAEGGAAMGARADARAIPETGLSYSRDCGLPVGLSGGGVGRAGLGPERAVFSLLGHLAVGH